MSHRRPFPHHASQPSGRAYEPVIRTCWWLIAMLSLLGACSNPPDVRLLDADNRPIENATIEVGETVLIYARSSGGGNFPAVYLWSTDDESVIGISNRQDLGGTARSADITGRAEGTTNLTFGAYGDGGRPIEDRSDRITFTVVAPEFPSVSLEANDEWWATTPAADFSSFETVRIQATFLVPEGSDPIEFNGDFGGDPAREVQVWTNPNIGTVSATAVTFPRGTYEAGDALSWDLTLNTNTWPDTEVTIAMRPNSEISGTLGPSQITLSSSDVGAGE